MASHKDPRKKEVKPSVQLGDVLFYLDAVERDRLDTAGWSRRSAELLHLREKLLKLRHEDFDAAIKTMKNVLSDSKDDANADSTEGGRAKRAAAMQLFQKVQGGEP